MRAYELMIGDFVLWEGMTCAVCATNNFRDELSLARFLTANITYHEIRATEVEPIHVTQEILWRNGFKISGYAAQVIDKETYLEYYFPEHRLRKVWRGIDEWDNHVEKTEITFQCQCFYVHELQHALRLCGIEKGIVL